MGDNKNGNYNKSCLGYKVSKIKKYAIINRTWGKEEFKYEHKEEHYFYLATLIPPVFSYFYLAN